MISRARIAMGLGGGAFLWIVIAAPACSGDAIGIDPCRRIEEARCRAAPSCNVPLTPPVSRPGREVDACVLYYRDACLHGLPGTKEPARADVDACIAVIGTSCTAVAKPESAPACAFLVPLVDGGAVVIPTPTPIVVPDAATD